MLRNLFLTILIFAALTAMAMAQSSAPTTATQTFTSDAGFSYTYPSDWTVINMKSSMPTVRKEAESQATSEAEKKGVNCTQIALMIEHGNHDSMIEALVMPFDCTGSVILEKDLADVGAGITSGLNSLVVINTSVNGSYKHGAHTLWADKINGTFKDLPEQKLQIEVVCGLMPKSLVCWITFAFNDADLKAFENSSAKIENEILPQLVPADAFSNSK